MRILLLVILAFALCASSSEGQGVKGRPFVLKDYEITWLAPTNHLPTKVWIYKVVPAKFSESQISNLLGICQFKAVDRKRVPLDYPVKDKHLLHFEDKDETRYLDIAPTLGFIQYYDSTAKALGREPVEKVPSEEQSLDLTLKILSKLGIPADQFATKPNSKELKVLRTRGERGGIDKKTGTELSRIVDSRGVILIRQVDGISFTGLGTSGGVRSVFGNHGKIAELQINWRNLQQDRSCTMPTAGEFLKQIKQGSTMLAPQSQIEVEQIQKLAITKVTLSYLGALGDEPQDMIYPFASLDAAIQVQETNTVIQLNSPLCTHAE